MLEPTPSTTELPTVMNIREPYHPPVLEAWGIDGRGQAAWAELLHGLGVEQPEKWGVFTAFPDERRFPADQLPRLGDTSTDVVITPQAITGKIFAQHYDPSSERSRVNTFKNRAASLLVRHTAYQAVMVERDGRSSARLIPLVALGAMAASVAVTAIESKYFGGDAQEFNSTGPALYGAAAVGGIVVYLRSGWREARCRAARIREQQPELINKLRAGVWPNFRVHSLDQQGPSSSE